MPTAPPAASARPRDAAAHLLARMLTGHPVELPPEGLPEPWDRLCRAVHAAPQAERLATFQAVLGDLPGGAAVLRAVFAEDPDAPADFSRFLLSSTPAAPPLPEWPAPPAPVAFAGLAGAFVRLVEPHTEADPAALLVQFLAAYGNVIGRSAHFLAEADRHHGNLFVVLVGRSAKGRKGSSLGQVRRLIAGVEPVWERERVQSGLSSGEGLVFAVRDAQGEDGGVPDKRLLVLEAEFAGVLRVLAREGNILSALLRQAWDSGTLRTLTRTNPLVATGAYISLIGHITADELRRYLTGTEAGNGFANRFLWVCVQRSKTLPLGGRPDEAALGALGGQLSQAVDFGAAAGELRLDEPARAHWFAVYERLAAGPAGLLGAVTGRAEAQVLRLALLYALLDLSSAIRLPHLEAALAVWRYCEASARYVFGDDTGNPDADVVLGALQAHPTGMTRGEIHALFRNRRSAGAITRMLVSLREAGLARGQVERTGGRPAERWCAVGAADTGVEERRKREKGGVAEPAPAPAAVR